MATETAGLGFEVGDRWRSWVWVLGQVLIRCFGGRRHDGSLEEGRGGRFVESRCWSGGLAFGRRCRRVGVWFRSRSDHLVGSFDGRSRRVVIATARVAGEEDILHSCFDMDGQLWLQERVGSYCFQANNDSDSW